MIYVSVFDHAGKSAKFGVPLHRSQSTHLQDIPNCLSEIILNSHELSPPIVITRTGYLLYAGADVVVVEFFFDNGTCGVGRT